jgi:hypothetical protein
MHVSFKNLSNKISGYDVNSDDKLSIIVPKLLEENKLDPKKNTFKFIFKGELLDHNKLFGDFTDTNLTIIYMVSKITEPIQPAPPTQTDTPAQPVNLFKSTPDNESDQQDHSIDSIDSVDKLRASVIGVLVFVRTNPQLAELFNNNFETLVNVLASNQIRPLFEKLVSENENSEPTESEYLDDLSESLLNINSNNHSNNPDLSDNSIQLSQDDMNNIDMLMGLGFNKQEATQAYIISNKNVDIAESMILDRLTDN